MNLRSDLPIKYYLNVYNEEELQDARVVLFNITQYLLKVAESKGKGSSPENLKFTTNSLKYIFGEKVKDEEFKVNLIKKIKSLIKEEFLEVKGETFHVKQLGISLFYELND